MRSKKALVVMSLCALGGILTTGAAILLLQDALLARWYVFQLENGGLETKKSAVEELGNHPTAFAVPPLLKAACDETLRHMVVESLVKIGRSGVPRLLEGLRSARPEGERAAAEALRRIEPKRPGRLELEIWFVANGNYNEKLDALRSFSEMPDLPESVIDLLTGKLETAEESTGELGDITEALSRQGAGAMRAVPALVDWLFRESGSTAHRAIINIGEPAAAALARELSRGDEDHRWRAALVLKDLGPLGREAVPALIAALEDRDLSVREQAARALGSIGPDARAAIPALIERLDDVEFYRDPASDALSCVGPDAAPALAALLTDGDSRRRLLAITTLRYMGVEALWAGEALLHALDDEELSVRAAAAALLAEMGERAEVVLPRLVEALGSDDRELGWNAYAGLRALGPRAAAALPSLFALLTAERHRDWIIDLLATLAESSEPAASALEAALGETCEVAPRATLLKVRRGSKDLERFLECLRGPQRSLRIAALREIASKHLSGLGLGSEVASILEEKGVMPGPQSDSQSDLLYPALLALEALGPEAKAAAPRLKELLHAESLFDRFRAAKTLHAIQPQEAGILSVALEVLEEKDGWVDAIPAHRRRRSTPELFAEAAELAATLGSSARAAEGPLRAALKTKNVMTCAAAACALWRITGDAREALAALLRDFERRQPHDVFLSPLYYLAWLDAVSGALPGRSFGRVLAEMGRPALDAILPLLEHNLYDVRLAACRLAARMGPAAIPALCRSLGDPHFRVAERAAEAIEEAAGSLGPEGLGAVEALLGDPDPRLAVRAARLLLKIKGAGAVQEVRKFLDRDDTRAVGSFLCGMVDTDAGGGR